MAHPSWGLGAVSEWHTHVGSRAPWGASRRLPKEMSHCSFLQGHLRNQRCQQLFLCWRRRGVTAPSTAPFPLPPFFLPSLSHFLHVSKLLVVRLTSSQENAVHLLKSLLEAILKQKLISARCTSLEKTGICLKSRVLDSAGIMMWLKRVPGYLSLWLMQNLSASLQY